MKDILKLFLGDREGNEVYSEPEITMSPIYSTHHELSIEAIREIIRYFGLTGTLPSSGESE